MMPLNYILVSSENCYKEQTKNSERWHVNVPSVQFIAYIYLHKCIYHLSYHMQQSYVRVMPAGEKEQQQLAWREGAGLWNEEYKQQKYFLSTLIQGEYTWFSPVVSSRHPLSDFALCIEIVHLDPHKIWKAIICVKHASNNEILLTITHIPLYTHCQSAISHMKTL